MSSEPMQISSDFVPDDLWSRFDGSELDFMFGPMGPYESAYGPGYGIDIEASINDFDNNHRSPSASNGAPDLPVRSLDDLSPCLADITIDSIVVPFNIQVPGEGSRQLLTDGELGGSSSFNVDELLAALADKGHSSGHSPLHVDSLPAALSMSSYRDDSQPNCDTGNAAGAAHSNCFDTVLSFFPAASTKQQIDTVKGEMFHPLGSVSNVNNEASAPLRGLFASWEGLEDTTFAHGPFGRWDGSSEAMSGHLKDTQSLAGFAADTSGQASNGHDLTYEQGTLARTSHIHIVGKRTSTNRHVSRGNSNPKPEWWTTANSGRQRKRKDQIMCPYRHPDIPTKICRVVTTDMRDAARHALTHIEQELSGAFQSTPLLDEGAEWLAMRCEDCPKQAFTGTRPFETLKTHRKRVEERKSGNSPAQEHRPANIVKRSSLPPDKSLLDTRLWIDLPVDDNGKVWRPRLVVADLQRIKVGRTKVNIATKIHAVLEHYDQVHFHIRPACIGQKVDQKLDVEL